MLAGGADDAFAFIGHNVSFGGNAGELRSYTSGGHTFVEGDVSGNGAADFQIELTSALHLSATDFAL